MIYHKFINDREVFSSCRTIELDGAWVSNPTEEQIALAGWEEYTPPEVVPSPQTEPDCTEVMEAVKMMLSSEIEDLSDEDALAISALYPTWVSRVGTDAVAGERLWYDGKLYKVVQAHTIQDDWRPDTTPALYAVVSIEEWPEIPETITAENPWMSGYKGVWKGVRYICTMDNCVWNPDQYPPAWRVA